MKIKTIIASLAIAAAMPIFTSCEKDLEMYSTETCRLNFYYSSSDYKYEYSQGSYSFLNAADQSITVDTVWVEVESMGFVRDYDRKITLQQIDTTGVKQAVAGQHYVAFNDPSLEKYYVMPAGKARTKLPIVVKRDASLKKESVVLKYAIVANNEFQNGYDKLQTRGLEITDQLVRPNGWASVKFYYDYYTLEQMMGEYGPVKHQVMIDATGFKWDDEFINATVGKDDNYKVYLLTKCGNYLKENGPFYEEDGTEVEFIFF